MGNSRPRYNQKGRAASTAAAAAVEGGKKRAYELDDSNVDIIDPQERKKRKAEAEALKEAEVVAAPKMSSKKKKRLDAFIARKLKKEDRKDLIASLAETQTTSLNLRSSSALGSKQFADQRSRLAHSDTVEESRRARAQRLLKNKKGRGHHSASDSEGSEDENAADLAGGEVEMDRVMVNAPTRSTETLASKPAPVFNASGSLGVVEVIQPMASTSKSPVSAAGSDAVTVGSGLKAGAVVTVIKKKQKQKGTVREMYGKGKGKAKEVAVEEEESSEFDSSEESGDESMDEEDATNGEEWKGIDDGNEDGADSIEAGALGMGVEEEDDNEEDGDESEEEGDDQEDLPPRQMRTKGSFQAWADAQILSASGLEAVDTPAVTSSVYDPYVPFLPAGSGSRAVLLPDGNTGPLGEVLAAKELPTMPAQRSSHVEFERSEEIQKARIELPVVKEEAAIMDAIRGNPVVVVCGETGSGKTTQIGQFLLEAGWGDASSDNPGMIAITQPRRVAALSTSQRVRAELCLPVDSTLVAHRIRYSSTTAADTKLVFMTDGVLLRALASDFLLKEYSVVVIDEAHERGVNTDVLIGVLSRVARLRQEMWTSGKDGVKPLRLVIMSATLRVSDFAENPTLFPKPPPVLHISARQHPVTMHFSRRTSPHYLDEAYKKVSRIHARLPAGGILVFCTGQNEIVSLVKKLEAKFSAKAIKARKDKMIALAARDKARKEAKEARKLQPFASSDAEEDDEEEDGEVEVGDDFEVEELDLGGEQKELAEDIDDGLPPDDDPEDLESSEDEDDLKIPGLDVEEDTDEPLHILPLYSLLPTEKQMRVFQDPPPNTRLVVIATNVAETAVTIPNIKYVVDSGRAKERRFDPDSGIQSFEVGWISKAGAAQRAGRAGRTGPGHCYRLYSSAVYENFFEKHNAPEILRMPIEGVVLQMKSMNIDAVANFPFPTPPDRESLRRAEKTLVNLGALEASESSSGVGGKITELGRSMALFPLSPRFSKMIVAGQQHGCLPYVIAVVCALSVGDPFIRESNLGDEKDALPDLAQNRALSSAEILHIRDPAIRAREELKVARKAFFDVQTKYLALGKGTSDIFKVLSVVGAYEYEGGRDIFCERNFVRTKAMQEIHKLRAQISKIVQATYPGIDAGFVPKMQPPSDTQLKVLRQLITSAFIDQIAVRKDLVDKSNNLSYAKVDSTRGVPYRAFGINEDLFIHPSSGLFHSSPPEFLVFQDLHRTHKVWLKTVTKINPSWIPVLGRPLCTFSKPLETTETALAISKANSTSATTRTTFVVPKFGTVELKPIQVEQKLVKGRWVFA